MPRITRVYTRKGDRGATRLGGGQEVAKTDLRIEAYGTIDELSSHLGVAAASNLDPDLVAVVRTIQNELFHLGSDLCFREEDKERKPVPRIEERHVQALELSMDRWTEDLGPLENFILPGGSLAAAHLHVARTVCRRAERCLVALQSREPIGRWTLPYVNRLSDALFVMARWENHRKGMDETCWNSRL
jgi:cob(I)alamin adenosyltransferase